MADKNYLTVRINDKCEPMDRGDTYEDPLNDKLQEERLGEVVGGGSQLNKDFKVEYCELEVEIVGDLEKAKHVIVDTLKTIGIPKGSKLILEKETIEFGNKEVMAVYFDNQLSKEIYEKNDINDIIVEFEELLGETGEMANHRAFTKETIIYYKGDSFKQMKEAIHDCYKNNALSSNGKIRQET